MIHIHYNIYLTFNKFFFCKKTKKKKKKKLKEVESFIKQHGIELYITPKLEISETFVKSTFLELCSLIDGWSGVDLSKTTTKLNTFRKYFNIGKNWWDQRKKKLLAPIFWLKIFSMIQKVCYSLLSLYLYVMNPNYIN